jgi:putative membrane protein
LLSMAVRALPLLAQMMDEHMDWNGGWGWLWMTLIMTVGVALVVLVVVLLVRASSGGLHMGQKPEQESPLDIARGRYASGEISSEEFERLRKDLGG